MKETIPEPGETCNRLSMPSHFSAQGAILAAMQFPKADRPTVSTADRASAETLALQALAWIAAEPDRLSGLMASTGLWPDEVRARAGDPAFLGGVLDFLLSDEAQLLAFCAETEIAPELPARLRAALPGGTPDPL